MTTTDLAWIIPLMIVLLALKGFFSGSEIALVSADRIKLGRDAKQGKRGARLVIEAFQHPERILTTTLIGTNIATVTLTTLGTLVMIYLFGNEAGDFYAFLFYTPIFLILGEIVPKAIYQEKASLLAPIVVYPLRFFSRLLAPIVLAFSSFARLAARWAGAPAGSQGLFATRDELRALVEMAERAPGTQVFDRFRIERAIRFPDATVGEHMVPAAEMLAVEIEVHMEEAMQTVRQEGHTCLPVYQGNFANVVGVLHITPWDLLDPVTHTRSVRESMRPALYVSPNESLEDLAALLRQRAERMAIVVDEFGSAAGIITMEDVAEAVVGEIDIGERLAEATTRTRPGYEVIGIGRYTMHARLPISEVNDLLGVNLPLNEFHTIGGLITSHLRHVPRPGEEVIAAGYRFIVEEASERRVKRVRAEILGRG